MEKTQRCSLDSRGVVWLGKYDETLHLITTSTEGHVAGIGFHSDLSWSEHSQVSGTPLTDELNEKMTAPRAKGWKTCHVKDY